MISNLVNKSDSPSFGQKENSNDAYTESGSYDRHLVFWVVATSILSNENRLHNTAISRTISLAIYPLSDFWSKMAGENVCEVPESHAKVKLNLVRLREIVKRYIDKVIWIENHYFPVLIEVLSLPECFDSCHLARIFRWWPPVKLRGLFCGMLWSSDKQKIYSCYLPACETTAVTYQHAKRPGIIPAQAPIWREPVRPSTV